jgi:hypothetical protein
MWRKGRWGKEVSMPTTARTVDGGEAQLFASVPEKNYLDLQDADGSYNAKKVAEFLKLNRRDLARAVSIPLSSVRFDERMTPELKKRITEIAVICEQVAGYFKGNVQKTSLWFSLPNTLLGNISPLHMIKLGRYKKLYHHVQNALAGNGP